MRADQSSPRRLARLLVWGALSLGVVFLILQTARLVEFFAVPQGDFIEYWSAARLNFSGGNPYSPQELLAVQQAAGATAAEPLIMYNPPWMLSLAAPFAVLSYPWARTAWLLVQFVLLVGCATWGWLYWQGSRRKIWLAWLVMFTFWPTFSMLATGQLGVFMLVGILGFAYAVRYQSWWAAGVALALMTLKPQLLYLFWLAWLFWLWEMRLWKMVLAGALVLVGLTLPPYLANPLVFQQYVACLQMSPPVAWATPTLGTLLRMWFGPERFWLQFLPMGLGLAWLLWYYWGRRGRKWCWQQALPWILCLTFVTSPYGWAHDQVILLMVILQVMVYLGSWPLTRAKILGLLGYVSIVSLAWVVDVLARQGGVWYIWLAPVIFAWWYVILKPWREDSFAQA